MRKQSEDRSSIHTTRPRSPKDAWDDQHRLLLSNPFVWNLKAESLMAAVKVTITDDKSRGLENVTPRRPRAGSL